MIKVSIISFWKNIHDQNSNDYYRKGAVDFSFAWREITVAEYLCGVVAELFQKNNKTRLKIVVDDGESQFEHTLLKSFQTKKGRTRTGLKKSSSTPVWMRLESDSTGKRCWELHGPSAGQVSPSLSQHGAYTHSSQYLKKKEKREGMSRERERNLYIYGLRLFRSWSLREITWSLENGKNLNSTHEGCVG